MMENKTIFSCPMKIVFSEAISYNKLSNIKQSIPNIIKIIFTSDFFFHNSINSWPKDMAKIAIVKDASFTETERSMSLANNSEKSPKIQNENLEKLTALSQNISAVTR
ncbi:MAG: hypothetical protein HWD59_09790 [Coxiellaceae bacterium]|nr:MAG: hypothetical protein HWD59_09790 [Coxiellaceae bacterium]